MSQLILDEQIDLRVVLPPLRTWITATPINELRPGEIIRDERVPAILQTLKQPTFVTIDHDFWDRELCHPGYSILFFDVDDDEQELLPGMLRALFRRPQFRTRAVRMGKVARVGKTAVQWWQVRSVRLQEFSW
jgi:hypothetical protein